MINLLLVSTNLSVDPVTTRIVPSVIIGITYDFTKYNTGATKLDATVKLVALKPSMFSYGGTELETASIMVTVLSKHNAGT